MIFRESNLKSLVPHTQFPVDFFKTFERKTVLLIKKSEHQTMCSLLIESVSQINCLSLQNNFLLNQQS